MGVHLHGLCRNSELMLEWISLLFPEPALKSGGPERGKKSRRKSRSRQGPELMEQSWEVVSVSEPLPVRIMLITSKASHSLGQIRGPFLSDVFFDIFLWATTVPSFHITFITYSYDYVCSNNDSRVGRIKIKYCFSWTGQGDFSDLKPPQKKRKTKGSRG